jgi:hypothetical protein
METPAERADAYALKTYQILFLQESESSKMQMLRGLKQLDLLMQNQVALLLHDMASLRSHLQDGAQAKNPVLQERDMAMTATVQGVEDRLHIFARNSFSDPTVLESALNNIPQSQAPPPAHMQSGPKRQLPVTVHASNLELSPPREALENHAGLELDDIELPAPTRALREAAWPLSSQNSTRQPTPSAYIAHTQYVQSERSIPRSSPAAVEVVRGQRLQFGSAQSAAKVRAPSPPTHAVRSGGDGGGKLYGRARRSESSTSAIAGFIEKPKMSAWNPEFNDATQSKFKGPGGGGRGAGAGTNKHLILMSKPPVWGPDETMEGEILPPYLRDETILDL